MAKKFSVKNPPPDSLELWVAEIAMAYCGSQQFMKLPMLSTMADANNMQPWHVAPLMALGARGLSEREDLLDEAAGYAYSSFEQNYNVNDADALPPSIAFAFVYVGAHLGLDIIDESRADEIMDLVEANQDALDLMIEKARDMFKEDNPFNFFLMEGGAGAAAASAPKAKKARKGAAKKGAPKPVKTEQVYVIEVSLKDIKPRIWRRIAVPGEFTLDQVHQVIQTAMGWGSEHLHEFEIGGQSYGMPDPEDTMGWSDDMLDDSEVRLCDVVKDEDETFHYTYDFGDDWRHQLVVKRIEPPKEGTRYPNCEAGKRAAPPEDCGGPYGYADILEALKDPKNKKYAELLEWVGKDYDPEACDLQAINARLKRLG